MAVERSGVRTLTTWEQRLLRVPLRIECPEMRLSTGRDGEPPVFVGPGYIEAPDWPSLGFTMFASALDNAAATRQLNRARENPYDIWEQFRLEAIGYDGVKWIGGWTQPRLKGLPRVGWPLTGALETLATDVSGWAVCPDAGVELIFRPQFHLPMSEAMVSVTSIGTTEVQRSHSPGRHAIAAVGSTIDFFYRPSSDSLWITAGLSSAFRHPWAENRLAEPLRILLGQLFFPRLIARNFGDGTAVVRLQRTPLCPHTLTYASLLGKDPRSASAEFWELYTRLLEYMVATASQQGTNSIGPHALTRFYDEIIQATEGSRWILSMTLASSAEGLLRISRPRLGRKTRHVVGAFKQLVRQGAITSDNLQSWLLVRNAVMHGSLTSPWAMADDERRLSLLADMVHRLTHTMIRHQHGTTVKDALPSEPPMPGQEGL